MTIGECIQQARKKTGISQKELGARLGVSGSMIGQYENDLRRPKAETVQKIADALGTTILEITMHARDYPLLFTVPTSELLNVVNNSGHEELRQSLLSSFSQLNEPGQQKAVERVSELTEVPKYRRSAASCGTSDTDTAPTVETPQNGSEAPTEGKK